jgi:hypothetical protein
VQGEIPRGLGSQSKKQWAEQGLVRPIRHAAPPRVLLQQNLHHKHKLELCSHQTQPMLYL